MNSRGLRPLPLASLIGLFLDFLWACAVLEEQMNSFCAVVGGRPPFTAAQWQELEHQALILKYLIAGVPVPPELIVPIRRSYEALAGRYFQSSSVFAGTQAPTVQTLVTAYLKEFFLNQRMLGFWAGRHVRFPIYPGDRWETSVGPVSYYSYYGKSPDPEPGRCRRTDGKKWRCSKDAYPGSKYCERHMHRGRNRSRKPVESQTVSSTQTTSSTSTSHSPCGNNASSSGVRNFQNIALHSTAGPSNSSSPCLSVPNVSQLPLDTSTLGNRYFTGFKAEVDEHSFFSETPGSERHLAVDNSWRLSTPASIFPPSKFQDSSTLQNANAQLQSARELGQVTLRKSFGRDFSLTEPTKHDTQFLRPFFDEWPNARESWSDLEEDRSNHHPTSFSTTQLSISLPMASPGFTNTSSRSPNED
ncbi:growth-regulating factor 5-like isoform X1 [Zingiber officinale]|uniref:growth-regulating factor 5-like isoform X1 n=1 Tax=Zingiber officinale TaxID=94328 RepID=UPI001C4AB62F|nr:growth-regulating factor 5-like isoform X1 [Zingiber officinale]